MKNFVEKKTFVLGVALFVPFVLLCVLFWFVNKNLNGGFIVFIDQTLLARKTSDLSSLFSLWGQNNLGYISSIDIPLTFSGRLLSWIIFRILDNQKEVYILFYLLGSYLIYFTSFFAFLNIQSKLFKNTNCIYPAITAFFYAFNFSTITNTGVLDSNFHVVAIAPIILFLLVAQLNGSRSIKYLLLEVFFIAMIINNIPFALGYLVTLYVPYLISTINNRNYFTLLIRYFLIVFLVLITSSYFIYAYFYAYKNIIAGAFYTGISNGGFIFLNNGMRGLFQLIYDWTIQIFFSSSFPHAYFHYYLGFVGLFSSYSLWLAIFYSVLTLKKNILGNKTFIFLLFAILLSLFLIKGSQSPFGDVNIAMYKVNSIMNIFRTPSSKFSLPIMLYLSVIILLIFNLSRSRVLVLFISLAMLIQSLPFFNSMRFIGYHSPYSEKSVGYITSEYRNISGILNTSNKSGALYMYPSNSAGYFTTDSHTFVSQDILSKLIVRPVIHVDDRLMNNAKSVIDNIPVNFSPTMGELSIRYVLLRGDYDISHINSSIDIPSVEKKLLESGVFKTIYSTNTLKLFELDEKYYVDLISAKSLNTNIRLEYKQQNPYQYKIKVLNLGSEDVQINFNNSFDLNWELKNIGKNKLSITRHNNKSNFGNKWTVSRKNISNMNEDVYLEIYYTPQKYLLAFFAITIVSFLILFVFIVKFWNKN
jgi:hypothetical protein